jgi:putative SOS response-associated peptidase YedK
VAEKPTFRGPFKSRRCVVPAEALYERAKGRWLRILPKHGDLFLIAAQWEEANERTEGLPTYTLVTTEPNEAVAHAHNRMPVILDPDAITEWLSLDAPAEGLRSHMVPCPPEWTVVEDAGLVARK